MEGVDGSVFEKFLTIVGDNKPTISEVGESKGVYPNLLMGGVCIGPCFYMIGDTVSLQFLEVSEGCKSVIGYSPQEIKKTGWDFHFHTIRPLATRRQPCRFLKQFQEWQYPMGTFLMFSNHHYLDSELQIPNSESNRKNKNQMTNSK